MMNYFSHLLYWITYYFIHNFALLISEMNIWFIFLCHVLDFGIQISLILYCLALQRCPSTFQLFGHCKVLDLQVKELPREVLKRSLFKRRMPMPYMATHKVLELLILAKYTIAQIKGVRHQETVKEHCWTTWQNLWKSYW